MEGVKIQKEKFQLQVKTLLGEKENLKETIDTKNLEVDDVNERSKMLEL